MLFGEGIVESLADFGAQGTWPTHTDVLDWLAADFMEHDWNIKRTIKLMVMSSAFRQSSRVTPEKLQADPQNRMNWQMSLCKFRCAALPTASTFRLRRQSVAAI